MANYAENIIVDKKDQLEKIEGMCLSNETILAVFDLKGHGTGFLGIMLAGTQNRPGLGRSKPAT
jgi:hypothetical protein